MSHKQNWETDRQRYIFFCIFFCTSLLFSRFNGFCVCPFHLFFFYFFLPDWGSLQFLQFSLFISFLNRTIDCVYLWCVRGQDCRVKYWNTIMSFELLFFCIFNGIVKDKERERGREKQMNFSKRISQWKMYRIVVDKIKNINSQLFDSATFCCIAMNVIQVFG